MSAAAWPFYLAGGGGGSSVPSVVVTVDPIADQDDLTPVVRTAVVTVGGVPTIPSSYSWSAAGPVTLTGGATATVSATPSGGGTAGLMCTVVVSGVTYRSEVVTFRVGRPDASGKWWTRRYLFNPAVLADHNWLTQGSLTVNGMEIRLGYDGTIPTVARILGGVLTISTVTGVSNSAGLWWYPIQAGTNLGDREVMWVAGIGPEITQDSDGAFIHYLKSGGAIWAGSEATMDAGVQKIAVAKSGANTLRATQGGLQARTVGLHLAPGRYAMRPQYQTAAWSGVGPAPDDSWVLAGGCPSGWYVTYNNLPSANVDQFAPNALVGSSPDEMILKYRAGLSMWAAG